MCEYSIIVIGKREERYIEPLLKELNKLPENYEIIFVFPKDDPTWKVIEKEMKREYKKVYDDGKGPGPARNLGFENSKGKYLLFIDADVEIKAIDIRKLFVLINKLDKVAYIYPRVIYKEKFFPKYFTLFGNILFGYLIGYPVLVLLNNILNVPLTLTNVFICRREDFVYFNNMYPGEDLDWGYRMKLKTGKKFKIIYCIKAYTFDRRLWNYFPFYLRPLSLLYTLFLYFFHFFYFIIFKKPLPLLKYRWIR